MKSYFLVFTLALAMLAAPVSAKKKSSRRAGSNWPVVAYTLEGCETCSDLKSYLRQCGVSLKIQYTDERYYDAYPTVFYSNGSSDHGERIHWGRTTLPKSLKVVETE